MKCSCYLVRVFVSIFLVLRATSGAEETLFNVNYGVVWGKDHAYVHENGREIRLTLDPGSGSGFASKQQFGSGFFQMKMKVPDRNSAGVVTAFYLTSTEKNNHQELDFEFLGNLEGEPITLQTNVFVNGEGNREQRVHLWFDPTAEYHTYKILWNQYQVVFYVDTIPIRVFKNIAKTTGVHFPTGPMRIEASIWDADAWATNGGQTKTNWSYAPFSAYFKDFSLDACRYKYSNCYSSAYWWNGSQYHMLDTNEEHELDNIRANFTLYDYCTDYNRYPNPPSECRYNH